MTVKKSLIDVLVINIGNRSGNAMREFECAAPIISDALREVSEQQMFVGFEMEDGKNDINNNDGLFKKNALDRIAKGSGEINVVFLVTNFASARTEMARKFIHTIQKAVGKKENTFLYHITFDMLEEFKKMENGFCGEHMVSEIAALSNETLPCLCDCSQTTFTIGYRRLAELMSRIIGEDLSEKKFPNYNWEMLSSIALHINRESFNMRSERIGTIPKYQFGEDGMPIIDQEMINQFSLNWSKWESNHPKAILKKVIYSCPHCSCDLDLWDFYERPNIIKCSRCGGLADAKGTDLLKK